MYISTPVNLLTYFLHFRFTSRSQSYTTGYVRGCSQSNTLKSLPVVDYQSDSILYFIWWFYFSPSLCLCPQFKTQFPQYRAVRRHRLQPNVLSFVSKQIRINAIENIFTVGSSYVSKLFLYNCIEKDMQKTILKILTFEREKKL